MAFQATCLLLVLAITFMHSIFGFFSGIINFFCTVVAVCVSLGFYEALSNTVVKSMELSPGYTEPICLVLLFLLTLSGLRFAADNLIRGNVHVPPWMDWTGAGICGFLNAQLIVGMVAISVLMLPLGGRVMMFERYERTEDVENGVAKFERNSLWTRPDEMTVGLFKFLSGGSLSSNRAFASVYPNFVDNVYFTTNTVQPESTPAPYREAKKGDGYTQGISLDQWWEPKGDVDCRYRKEVPTEKSHQPTITPQRYKPAAGNKLIATRLVLDPSSADRNRSAAWHMFRPTMMRIVGTSSGKPANYVARIIGGVDELIGGNNRLCDLDTNFSFDGAVKTPVDVYFEVDEEFRPEFVEYRRHARAAVTGEPAKTPPLPLQYVDKNALAQQASQQPTFASAIEPASGDNFRLPFALAISKIRGREGVELAGEKFVRGRVQGSKSGFEPTGEEPSAKDIQLPPGYKLLQIRWEPRKVRTLVGQVFAFVDQIKQFEVIDDRGEPYQLNGYFGPVTRPGGKEDFELFLNGLGDTQADPSYKFMLDFKYLKRQDVQDGEKSTIGLFFFVKPGVRIVTLRSGNETQTLSIPIGP